MDKTKVQGIQKSKLCAGRIGANSSSHKSYTLEQALSVSTLNPILFHLCPQVPKNPTGSQPSGRDSDTTPKHEDISAGRKLMVLIPSCFPILESLIPEGEAVCNSAWASGSLGLELESGLRVMFSCTTDCMRIT